MTYHTNFGILFFLLLILIQSCKPSNSELPPPSPFASKPPSKEDLLVNTFTHYVENNLAFDYAPGMGVAIVSKDSVLFAGGFGVKVFNTIDSVNKETIFRIASLSKGFAPILTGMLVEEGKLDWDDKIVQFLPDFKLKTEEYTQSLSIRHVLSHTTGLPRHTYSNLLNMEVPYQDIKGKLSEIKQAHPVGTHYNYQNVAYSLIGDVIEKVAGKPYGEVLKDHIFRPLQMEGASTSYQDFIENPNSASPHVPRGESIAWVPYSTKWYDTTPASGVNASIQGMAKWLQLLLGQYPDLISPETLDSVFYPQVSMHKNDSAIRSWKPFDKASYALGWRVVDYNGMNILYHGGFVKGYRAEIGFSREEEIGVVFLSNGHSYLAKECVRYFFDLYMDIVCED